MPIATTAGKDVLAAAYASTIAKLALFTSTPSSTPGSEPSGGSPAYARKTPTVSTPSTGSRALVATFDVPAGATIVGWGAFASDGTYVDGGTMTSQAFTLQSTLALTVTYAQA